MEKPNVFKYHDYLLFISDWINHNKSSDPFFSIRKWCHFIESSPSLITLIMKKERDLSDALFGRMILQMNLKKNEREALSFLRVIARSENAEERSAYYSKLIKIPEYKKENKENLKIFEYLSNWLNVAIRELAFTDEFRDDPLWIKDRLRNSADRKEIENALNFLKNNSYIQLDENKKWRPLLNQVDCSEGVYKLSLTDFHTKMFEFAALSIHEVSREQRFLSGHTFSVSGNQFEEAKQILEEALRKIEQLTPNQTVSDVYHLEIALFPLTKINKDYSNEK